jgi:hypothetical protein
MITELCIDVINSFRELKSALGTAREHICILDKQLPAWFQPPASLTAILGSSSREQACNLLGQLEYLDGQQPREILVGAGIIAASSETLEAIEALNRTKNKFKAAMLKLKAAKIATHHELLAQNFEQLLAARDTQLAVSLQRMGLARVHLKQCYRKIPFFMQRPQKISWTWANTRSIKKTTIAQAEELLLKHTRDEGIERQLKLLHGLDPLEPLAIIQDLAPHLRANLVMPASDGVQRMMVKGPVPIFYLDSEGLPLPEFTQPGTKRGKNKDRVIRSDVKIDPEPFLPAIRAHRYYKVSNLV